MGVRNLWPLLASTARPINVSTLDGRRIAVDASIWIYHFLKAMRDGSGNALAYSHVVGFFRRICKLMFLGIKPVFVFDGVAPELKRMTIARRRSRREGMRDNARRTAEKLLKEQMQREIDELLKQQSKEKRDSDEVTEQMTREVQKLLTLFGIPFITAPTEAEAQCAKLIQLSLVDGIITDDSDCFLFGGTKVYKNFFNQNKYVECYQLEDIDRELALDRSRLIEMALVLGSDYTDGLAGVGPVTAMELLAE
ncbi:PIN domain-like protein, partial [Nadsonia fulvescens var. elongata DSM 6958]